MAVPGLRDLLDMDPLKAKQEFIYLHPVPFQRLVGKVLEQQQVQHREKQLRFYQPVSAAARKLHESKARRIGVFGGNRASKTDTCLAELSVLGTGVVPLSLRHIDWDAKFRGPRRMRVVVQSLTTTLHPTILPKLQYWRWNGDDVPGGVKGHWGWIPRDCLIGQSWEKSWSEKLRTLTVLYRDPKRPEKVLGESTFQFLSKDQDASDFASGEFHDILHDEPPTLAIWRENEARVMSVGGRLLLAMTWPDDPAIAVDWIFDEVYERGQPGPGKDPEIDCITLHTLDNPNIDQAAIAIQARAWSPEITQVKIYGQHMRFSNRIHPLFTSSDVWWCYGCQKSTFLDGKGACVRCQGATLSLLNHVKTVEPNRNPAVFALDPHPRKPHMFLWIQVTPEDDFQQIAEGECDGDPGEVKAICDRIEHDLGITVAKRLIDPNMGRSPSGARRGITWQDEFDRVGLVCDLADDSDPGRGRLNEHLKPDPRTQRPRVKIDPTNQNTIRQLLRYRWDDHRQRLEKDLKQRPNAKDDDFPTLWKYVMNDEPTFAMLREPYRIIRRRSVA